MFGFNSANPNSQCLANMPLTSGVGGKVAGGATFTRASDQWCQDDAGVWQKATTNVPAFNSKGVLLEPASTNKCTCYGVIPADSYAAAVTSGAVLVLGRKYEIVTRSTIDFTTRGAANNSVGTQFVLTAACTLGAGDSVKEVQFAVGTKSYWTGAAFQQNHAGMTISGDTAAILSTVNDAAALATGGLGVIAASGKVYKLDNSAGAAVAVVTFTGAVGNTNAHSSGIFWRGVGNATWRLNATGTLRALGAGYARELEQNVTPTAMSRDLRIEAAAGTVTYFLLPQLEELPFCTSPIVPQGAAASRVATPLTYPPTGNVKVNDTTVYMEITPTASRATNVGASIVLFQFGTADAVNDLSVYWQASSGTIRVRNNNSGVVASIPVTLNAGATIKLAVRLSSVTGLDIFQNGIKGTNGALTTDVGSLGTVVSIGNSVSSSAYPFCGYIGKHRIIRRPLSDARLVTMTT